MFLIFNALSFLASCLSPAASHPRCSCSPVSCGSALCPVALCPGLLLLLGGFSEQPMFLVALGLFPCCWTGSLEEQGLGACRLSSQPCVHTVPWCPSAAAADGALELAAVETATCLGLSTSPRPTSTSLVTTHVSLGLV